MPKLGLLAAATTIALASVVACTSSDPGAAPSSPSSGTSTSSSSSSGGASTGAGSAWAEALCAHNDECDSGFNLEAFGSTAACVTAQDSSIAPAKAAPDTGVTDAALAACTAAIRAAGCTTRVLDLDACIFKGKRANSAPCGTREQCATGLCLFADDGACGTCNAGGAVGAACDAQPCAPGLGCDGNLKCAALPATGGDCSTLPCASLTERCVLARCVNGAAKGATCTPRSDASDDSCGPMLECVNGTCASVAVTGQAGQACGTGVECVNGSCIDGKCVASLAEGAACNDGASDEGPFCGGNLECIDGKCRYESTVPACN